MRTIELYAHSDSIRVYNVAEAYDYENEDGKAFFMDAKTAVYEDWNGDGVTVSIGNDALLVSFELANSGLWMMEMEEGDDGFPEWPVRVAMYDEYSQKLIITVPNHEAKVSRD